MLRYYFTIAHDLVFDYIFCDLIFLWSCPLYDVRWIWSFFLKFIYSADCLHLLTSWSEVDYLLCFPFLCGLIIVNSLTLQRNSRRFFPPRNASPLLKSLMRLSFSLSLSLFVERMRRYLLQFSEIYHAASLCFLIQTPFFMLGARMYTDGKYASVILNFKNA